jgi:hypothetical protein
MQRREGRYAARAHGSPTHPLHIDLALSVGPGTGARILGRCCRRENGNPNGRALGGVERSIPNQ